MSKVKMLNQREFPWYNLNVGRRERATKVVPRAYLAVRAWHDQAVDFAVFVLDIFRKLDLGLEREEALQVETED